MVVYIHLLENILSQTNKTQGTYSIPQNAVDWCCHLLNKGTILTLAVWLSVWPLSDSADRSQKVEILFSHYSLWASNQRSYFMKDLRYLWWKTFQFLTVCFSSSLCSRSLLQFPPRVHFPLKWYLKITGLLSVINNVHHRGNQTNKLTIKQNTLSVHEQCSGRHLTACWQDSQSWGECDPFPAPQSLKPFKLLYHWSAKTAHLAWSS